MEVMTFLLYAVAVSLSGVLSPGPMTAAAIGRGSRSPHSGSVMAIGHGVIEIPLLLLIILGIGPIFQSLFARTGIGIFGGGFLIWMGISMLKGADSADGEQRAVSRKGPFMTGLLLSAGNPYFLIWWATVGLNLVNKARQLGGAAFFMFAVIHWLCDLFWLELLSFSSYRGMKLLNEKSRIWIERGCAIVMIIFGLLFIYNAASLFLGR